MAADPAEIDAILADPMHIDNVRARLTAQQVERDMLREIAREIDVPPQNTPFGMLRRALSKPAESA